MFGRRIFIDIWITAFMSLTLVFFALSERYPERRRLFLVLMYVAVGLGVLTKGPVAIALPALAFPLYLLVQRELRRVGEMMIPLGALIVAADRGALVRGALSRARLDLHPVVPGQRERRALYVRLRRSSGPQPVVLPARRPQRLVSVVARADCRRARGVAGAGPLHRPAVVLDRRHRRILLAVGGQAGPVHLSDHRRCRRPARRRDRARPAASGVAFVDVRDGCARSVPGRGCGPRRVVAVQHGRPHLRARWRCCRRSLRPDWRSGGSHRVASEAPGRGSGGAPRRDDRHQLGVRAARAARVSSATSRPPPSAASWRRALLLATPSPTTRSHCPAWSITCGTASTRISRSAPLVDALHTPRKVFAVLSERDYAALEPSIGTPTCVIERFETFDVKLRRFCGASRCRDWC